MKEEKMNPDISIVYIITNIFLWAFARFSTGQALPAGIIFVAAVFYLVIFVIFFLLHDTAMTKMSWCSLIVVGVNWFVSEPGDISQAVWSVVLSVFFTIAGCVIYNRLIKKPKKQSQPSEAKPPTNYINHLLASISQAVFITFCLKY